MSTDLDSRIIRAAAIVREAAGLLSEEGENTEYDRAITELVTFVLGGTGDDKDTVLDALRAIRGDDGYADHPYCDLCGENRVFFSLREIGICFEHHAASLRRAGA